MKGYWPGFQQHLEWWSGVHMQYSGTTNLLFWVPQQALAAWVGFPLLLHTIEKQKHELTSLGAVAMPLWSPFICIGVAPFLVWQFFKSRPQYRQLLLPAVIVLSFTVIFYLFSKALLTE